MTGVAETIDSKFGNSDFPTNTQTEAAFRQMFVDMLGNVQLYIQVIGLAVVFALSLVTANAMAMSMRGAHYRSRRAQGYWLSEKSNSVDGHW